MGGKTRPPYPDEFRDKAIELARSSDRSINQIADELGVSGQTLRTGCTRPRSTPASAAV